MKQSAIGTISPYLVPLVWALGIYFMALLAKKGGHPFAGHIWITLGFVFWSLALCAITRFNVLSNWQFSTVGACTGLFYALGGLVFVLAMVTSGKPLLVGALSSAYPAILAIMLVVFQGQAVTPRQIIAIALFVAGGWIISGK